MSTTRKTSAAAPADELPLEGGGAGPMPSSSHTSLAHALLEAQRLIAHGVTKSGLAKVESRTGASYTYKYASGEDMMAGCREALLAVGLLWTLESYSVEEPEDPEGLAIFTPVYLLEHPDSGESRRYTFPMPISMSGAADKALAGARTYTCSYALRDVLLVPRPDPNEPDKRANDNGVGSWRGRTGRGDKAAEPKTETNPKRAASEALMAAWRELAAASRARGEELSFGAVYRQAMGKTWPGNDKAALEDLERAKTEFERRLELIDEVATGGLGPDDDENLGDSRSAMDADEGDRS